MKLTPLLVTVALVTAACETDAETDMPIDDAATDAAAPASAAAAEMVSVELLDADGQSVGTAELTQQEGGVQIAIHVMGLAAGEHGFHVHETGSCTAPDFTSAGGHFAPDGRQHGTENPDGPHAGDMPNLVVAENGMADTTFVHDGITLRTGEPNSVFRDGGTALVIHEGADDYRTDPSGDAGSRIACGVIELR